MNRLQHQAILTLLFLQLGALASTPCVAQVAFTEADLAGVHAFSCTTPSGALEARIASGDPGRQSKYTLFGVLEADGAGLVTGSRLVHRSVTEVISGFQVDLRQETVAQSFEGTYVVNPDGTGRMEITATPNPPWEAPSEGTSFLTIDMDRPGREVIRFALADGGRRLHLTHELQASRDIGILGRADVEILLVGSAERQEPDAPEPDPRIDVLLDEVDRLSGQVDDLSAQVGRLSAQLCEVIRLLHTPQGQRSTDSDDVVDECGTTFDWNGEGTDRRGRRGSRP